MERNYMGQGAYGGSSSNNMISSGRRAGTVRSASGEDRPPLGYTSSAPLDSNAAGHMPRYGRRASPGASPSGDGMEMDPPGRYQPSAAAAASRPAAGAARPVAGQAAAPAGGGSAAAAGGGGMSSKLSGLARLKEASTARLVNRVPSANGRTSADMGGYVPSALTNPQPARNPPSRNSNGGSAGSAGYGSGGSGYGTAPGSGSGARSASTGPAMGAGARPPSGRSNGSSAAAGGGYGSSSRQQPQQPAQSGGYGNNGYGSSSSSRQQQPAQAGGYGSSGSRQQPQPAQGSGGYSSSSSSSSRQQPPPPAQGGGYGSSGSAASRQPPAKPAASGAGGISGAIASMFGQRPAPAASVPAHEAPVPPMPRPGQHHHSHGQQQQQQQQHHHHGGGGGYGGGGGFGPGSIPPGADEVASGPMVECPTCGRNFNESAYSKHAKICEKVFATKRKPINMAAKRLEGSEAVKFFDLRKGVPKSETKAAPGPANGRGGGRGGGLDDRPLPGSKVPKWKAQSQQLRAAMAANRQIVDAKAKGMDIKSMKFDTGPQAPDDRVQCPHCGRKFAELTAERHIPKCRDIMAKPGRLAAGGGRGAHMRR